MIMKGLAAVGGALMLSGCIAPAIAGLGALGGQMALSDRVGHNAGQRALRKQMTASAISSNLNADTVRISHFNRTESTETWIADTPDGRYSCSVARGHTNATCVRG